MQQLHHPNRCLSQPSSRHFLWFVVLTSLPCHDLAPPSFVNINALVLERVASYDCGKFLKDFIMPPYVSPLKEGDFARAQDMLCGLSVLALRTSGVLFFPHRTTIRFAFKGRISYTDLMRKLIRSDAIFQM